MANLACQKKFSIIQIISKTRPDHKSPPKQKNCKFLEIIQTQNVLEKVGISHKLSDSITEWLF